MEAIVIYDTTNVEKRPNRENLKKQRKFKKTEKNLKEGIQERW